MSLSKKELRGLAKELGFRLSSQGSAWVAVHKSKRSKVDPDRNVTFQGTRKRMSRTLLDIKEWQRLREKHSTGEKKDSVG